LIETAFYLHRTGAISPDTYIIDVDSILENSHLIYKRAEGLNVKLYCMLKQLGRNPYLAKELISIGFDGVVCVDFRDAEMCLRNNIKIGHAGHLTQLPSQSLQKILQSDPEIITIYSKEKAKEISDYCISLGRRQSIMLRVLGEHDFLYPGQYGGFRLSELSDTAKQLALLPGIDIKGITSFPCFLYNEETNSILPTPNADTVRLSANLMRELGFEINQLNMPSAACCESMPAIAQAGATHTEPGHGICGTTPFHAYNDAEEKPAIVYVSEVTHNLGDRSYCLGGGRYPRGHLMNALVGKSLAKTKLTPVIAPDGENIDYHFELQSNSEVGDTAVMAFRAQIFVTRSQVALVSGISTGKPVIDGIYSSQGEKI
jgi:predicted amino acid racemase